MSQRSQLALKTKGTLIQYCTPEKVCCWFRCIHDIGWSFILKLVVLSGKSPIPHSAFSPVLNAAPFIAKEMSPLCFFPIFSSGGPVKKISSSARKCTKLVSVRSVFTRATCSCVSRKVKGLAVTLYLF